MNATEKHWIRMIAKIYEAIISQNTKMFDKNLYFLSPVIVKELVDRFLKHKDVIEESNPGMNGSDSYKKAGYLTFWIAKMKPIQILDPNPSSDQLMVNEYLAIAVANTYLFELRNKVIESKKITADLRYLLRYRVNTLRVIPIIYETYFEGYRKGITQRDKPVSFFKGIGEPPLP